MRIKLLVLCLCCQVSSTLFAADYEGRLDWSTRAELGMLVSGVVDKVAVKVGQLVSKGDLLLQLDERDFSYQLSSAKTTYQRAKASYDEAKVEYEKSLEMVTRRLLSDQGLQWKKTTLLEAQAVMEQSQSAMEQAQLDLERGMLKAPYDGMVIKILVGEGEAVLNRLQLRPLVILVATGQMHAVARIDEKTAAKLKEGTPASVGVRGDWLIGNVLEVGREAVQITDKDAFYLLTATFTPGEVQLRAGEKAIIRIQE